MHYELFFRVPINKFIICDKLMAAGQKHLYQTVETLTHLQSTVVLDNKRHLKLWVLL